MTALAGRKVGDEVLFYAGKKFVARARIIGLFDNRALAEAVWGTDENQKTWQHIMALDEVAEFEVPAEPVLRGLGVPVPLRSLTLVGAEERLRFLDMVDPAVPARSKANPPSTGSGTGLGRNDLLRALANLKTHAREQRPSRHKPITLLWAIGRLAAERKRMVEWQTFREEVGPLLRDFGLADSRVTPEYPFWHLRSSGLWDVEGIKDPKGPPTPSRLAEAGASAGFSRDAAKVLRRSLARAEAIGLICSTYLGGVDREALLDRIGLGGYASASGELPDGGDDGGRAPRRSRTSSQPVRDSQLVERIKVMYEHTCQVCGARVETQHSHYSEAAHIRGLGRPHHGPDRLSNLLCLCPNHHVEFDRLAIYIDEDWAVRRNSTGNVEYQLKRHADHVIEQEYLEYHRGLCGRG
ncbi:HNH endonuclease [Streptomyces sp. DvalAA-19]|uniref:HNH endonuclease n=1 Tax=Streptomyces sp. DvalAA-19 TaxID=1839761 RepID=UPI00081BBCB8|nr:HNH endonuclease [Streptomyces sp. DvalAA-19]SCD32300.1 putative restriction endonuclease [Streptomyces sp. DvalAA-19]